MGCDICLTGSQNNELIQENCIQFLKKLMNQEEHYTFLPHSFPLKVVYKGNEWGKKLVCSQESFTKDSLYGISLLKYGGYPLQILFDRTQKGILCNLVDPKTPSFYQIDLDQDQSLNHYHLWFGSRTRISSGQADLFVIAYALKKHFIPDLQISADFHIDFFESILVERGLSKSITESKIKNLNEVVSYAIQEAQECYDQVCQMKLLAKQVDHTINELDLNDLIVRFNKLIPSKIKAEFDSSPYWERIHIHQSRWQPKMEAQAEITEFDHELLQKLNRSVKEFELSVRTSNVLKSVEIEYIGDLVQKTEQEMLKTKNLGRKSLRDLKEILASMNLCFGMKLINWTPKDKEIT